MDVIKGYAPKVFKYMEEAEKSNNTLADADFPAHIIQDSVKLSLFLKPKTSGQAHSVISMCKSNGEMDVGQQMVNNDPARKGEGNTRRSWTMLLRRTGARTCWRLTAG